MKVKRKLYLKLVKRNSILLIALIVIINSACNNEKVSEEILVKVYVENVIIEETYGFNQDSLKAHKQLVFNKYKITEAEFRKELSNYSDNREKWESFFKKSNEYLNELKKGNTIN